MLTTRVLHRAPRQRWPRLGALRTESIILPLIYQYSAGMTSGTTSPTTSIVLVGLASQLWLRRYHPGWFRQYNYILGTCGVISREMIEANAMPFAHECGS